MLLAALIALLPLAQAHQFEVCTPENEYLEALLPPPVHSTLTGIPQLCVETAHLTLAPTGYYGFCPMPQGKPERTHPRACVSEKYVSVIHSALLDVTDCLEYDAKLAFSTFNLESAMHLNAVGRATDVGVGQLTKSAIDEVTLNALARAQRKARNSTKDSCARILADMTEHPSDIDNRCGFMSLPENPVRNIVYSVLLLQQNRRVVNNLWNRLQIQLPPEVDVERLKTMIAMLGYNAGTSGVVTTLKAYIDQSTAPLTDHHFNFELSEPDNFRSYLLLHFPSTDEATRKRVSKYIGYVINSARRVDGIMGATGACLPTYFAMPTFRTSPMRATPDFAVGAQLVKTYALRAAKAITEKKECATARHDFRFAFLPKGSSVEQLPDYLKEVYAQLCAN